MLGPLSYALGRLPFSHKLAQTYELLSAQRSIRRFGQSWLDVYDAAVRQGAPGEENEVWFRDNKQLSASFIAYVRDKTNLEIGSGPMGYLAARPWMGRRVVIDPLVDRYREYQFRRFGKTVWTNDVTTYSVSAEDIIPSLVGAVDGAIICRNALDHTEDPFSVLAAISQYAAPGCYLLLWTDIWHARGVTIGHRNITRSLAAMDALLGGLGFDIVQACPPVRAAHEFVEYGRLARKRSS